MIDNDLTPFEPTHPEEFIQVEAEADSIVMRYFPSILTDEQTESFYNRIQSEYERKGWGLCAVELKFAEACVVSN